jgi:uncharacterized membrane protein YfcA
MSFTIYLPIAGSSVNLLLLVGLGGLVGLLSGLFGVGGGFLLTPLLMMIGIPPTVAAASDSNQIVAACTSGTFSHARSGNVDFKMGILMLIGGLVGGTLGVRIIKILRIMGEANFVITVTYVVMLGGIGSYMFYDSLRELRGGGGKKWGEISPGRLSTYARLVNCLPWKLDFKKSGIRISAFMPLMLGAMVGVLAAIMGIGGGFIMVPVMVYLLRMPMHIVVGTNLFQEVFMCANVTAMQARMNHTVDFVLALLLLFGSVLGAQLGARISKRLKADQLKILLAATVLLVMVQMLLGLLIAPEIMLSYLGGH